MAAEFLDRRIVPGLQIHSSREVYTVTKILSPSVAAVTSDRRGSSVWALYAFDLIERGGHWYTRLGHAARFREPRQTKADRNDAARTLFA